MSVWARSGPELPAWTINGLLTPPTLELELPSGISSADWGAHIKKEDDDYSLSALGELGPACAQALPRPKKRARYQDFLGTGPGLLGTDMDSDPDLTEMRELKNRYSKRAEIINTPVTPPLTPRPSTVVMPHIIPNANVQDDEWVDCCAENDGNGPAIRGWSPPESNKYPAVDISLGDWNQPIALPAGPGLSLLRSQTSSVDKPSKTRTGLGISVAGLPLTDSQQTICVGDSFRTPRASLLNVKTHEKDSQHPYTIGRVSERVYNDQEAGASQKIYSRRHGPTWGAQNAGRAAKRKRNVLGAFMPGPSTSKVLSPPEMYSGKEEEYSIQQHPHSLKPSSYTKPMNNKEGCAQEPESSGPEMAPKARPLAFLPPHLARSITRNASLILAQDCEKARNKALESLSQPPTFSFSQTEPTISHGSMSTSSPIHTYAQPHCQEYSPEIPAAPPSTPMQPFEPNYPSTTALPPKSEFQYDNYESNSTPLHLPVPVSMPASLPLRLGRTASDPGSRLLLRSLAASLAHSFTQKIESNRVPVAATQDTEQITEAQSSEAKAVISAVCEWAAASDRGSPNSVAEERNPICNNSVQSLGVKREVLDHDFEQSASKKIRAI